MSMTHTEVLNGLGFKCEVRCSKTSTLSLNPSVLITVRCVDWDLMPLYCRLSCQKAFQCWTDVLLWILHFLSSHWTQPTVYLFARKQSLLLLISFTLHHRSVSWKWQTVSTTGRMRTQLDVGGVHHQMGRTDCFEAHRDQQLICNDCLDLVVDSLMMTDTGEQGKIKSESIAVRLTGSDLRRDEFRSHDSGWKTLQASQLFYFNHFICLEKPTKGVQHNNQWYLCQELKPNYLNCCSNSRALLALSGATNILSIQVNLLSVYSEKTFFVHLYLALLPTWPLNCQWLSSVAVNLQSALKS